MAGPVVEATGLPGVRLFDVVRIGGQRLTGEVIRLDGDSCVAQVFEDTTGLRVGDPAEPTGGPLTVELGPGLLGSIVDGMGRPLDVLAGVPGAASGHSAAVPWQTADPYVPRGADPPRLDRDRRWRFTPAVEIGDVVEPGDVLGTTPEGPIEHRVLVPDGVSGPVSAIGAGEFTVTDEVVRVGDRPVTMAQRWPVRQARPVRGRRPLTRPLVTGQRVLDVLFPVARGGAAIIPGGFGTGKTVTETSLAKYAEADVVVYVGCGERGNELTEVLQEFPELVDPRTGAPLMQRTVLVANTSNMPVAAREASVYTGITIAEYYRDQGYHVALMADSTSRWGEALREVSSRLEEIPAEDGYPAYLATRLAGFYERAGEVECRCGAAGEAGTARIGSVTIVGAVSPAGGDFSEPITQNSLRLAGCFWALDTSLARRRHFPSVNWTRSYSQYPVVGWFDQHVAADWGDLRRWALALLAQEASLQEVVQLLGVEALAPEQRVVLRTGRLLREDFLQQSAFDEVDASCPPAKQIAMLRAIHHVHRALTDALERGVPARQLSELPALAELGRMKAWPADDMAHRCAELTERITQEVQAL
ncbi:MAG: V-type ATP synthase subunit A [Kineosporiaceae bacterium]|nr:V-type ATP synthase subunit A [Kineosporiaceae bacterium]